MKMDIALKGGTTAPAPAGVETSPAAAGDPSDGQPRKSWQRAIEFVTVQEIGVVSDEPLARSTIRPFGCSTNLSLERQDGRDGDIGD